MVNKMKDKMTVKEFLEAGYKFEVGDVFLQPNAVDKKIVDSLNIVSCNSSASMDSERYVIKSAALEREEKGNIFGKVGIASDEREWKSGDKCIIVNDDGLSVADGFYHLIGSSGVVVSQHENKHGYSLIGVEHENGTCVFWRESMLVRPQQKEDQAKLEAAYDLYCTAADACDIPPVSFSYFCIDSGVTNKNKWLAIVEKTGYRVEK